MVKAIDVGGASLAEVAGFKLGGAFGARTAGLDVVGVAVGNVSGVAGAGLDTVGVTVGDASVGTDVPRVGIEVGV